MVGNLFPWDYHIALKAVCARTTDKAQIFANQWGYEGGFPS
jgi:hypothetical protein